jgi:hypothetical protein
VRRRWWLVLAVLILAIPLGLLLRNFARDVLLVEFLRVVWGGRILFESLPQLPIWLLLVFLGLLVAVRSLLGHPRPGPLHADKVGQYRGRISRLAGRIRRSAGSGYYKWHLARHLRTMVLDALAYEHRLTLEEVRQRLDSGALDAPPEVLAYLCAGLTPIYSRSSGLLWRLRHRLASSVQSTTIDPDLLRVVEFLEDRFETGHGSQLETGETTARQPGIGQPLEVQHGR